MVSNFNKPFYLVVVRFQKTQGMAHGKAIQYRTGEMCLQSISGNTPAKGDIVSLGKKCMEGSDAYDRVFTFPHPGKCFSSLLRLRYENATPNFCWASVHCWVSCAINKRVFLRLHLCRHTFASLWGACLRFGSLWRTNSHGDLRVLSVHLSNVCWGLLFCLRKEFIF